MDTHVPNRARIERLTREMLGPTDDSPPPLASLIRAVQVPLLALIAACAMVGAFVEDKPREAVPAPQTFVGVEPAPSAGAGTESVQDMTY